jgi:L-aspartate oxidase
MQDGMELASRPVRWLSPPAAPARSTARPPTQPARAATATRCVSALARLADCEFVQFHPTTLYIAGASRFLISEVVRGAGAVLRDRNGERFMVAANTRWPNWRRATWSAGRSSTAWSRPTTPTSTSTCRRAWRPAQELFPSIARICSTFDLDVAKDPMPVRPGAHYFVGGAGPMPTANHDAGPVRGRRRAASGLHGANRLASNSLLEGRRLGRATGLAQPRLARATKPWPAAGGGGPPLAAEPPRLLHDDLLYSLKSLMWRQVGLNRDAAGLRDARQRIGFWHHYLLRSPLATAAVANWPTC